MMDTVYPTKSDTQQNESESEDEKNQSDTSDSGLFCVYFCTFGIITNFLKL